MKKSFISILILLSFFAFTGSAFAGTTGINLTVCESGCDYSSLNDVYSYIMSQEVSPSITITIKDNRTYDINGDIYLVSENDTNLTIQGEEGNEPTINLLKMIIESSNTSTTIFKNIKVNSSDDVRVYANEIIIENVDLNISSNTAKYFSLVGDKISINKFNYNNDNTGVTGIYTGTAVKNSYHKQNLKGLNFYPIESSKEMIVHSYTGNFTNHIIDIKNSNFNTKSSEQYNYNIIYGNTSIDNCNFESSFNGMALSDEFENIIKNSKISSNQELHDIDNTVDLSDLGSLKELSKGIIVFHSSDNYIYDSKTTTITNSDLSNNDYSAVGSVLYYIDTDYISTNKSDIIINKSKLNRILSTKDVKDLLALPTSNYKGSSIDIKNGLKIYASSDNTWNDKLYLYTYGDTLKKGTSLNNVNAFESVKGNITIDLEKNITVNVGETKSVSLANLFNTYDIENINDADWVKVNNSVVDVEDGGIVILSAGTNTIEASYNGINYKVNVTVNEEVINPQTGIKKVSIILVIIVSLLYIINSFVIKKMKFKKI